MRTPSISARLLTTNSARVFATLVLIVATVSACNQPPAVNPWRDDAISPDTWSTPSRDSILAKGHEPAIRPPRGRGPQRNAPRVRSDSVPHYPIWWEDPLEDKGDQNASFAWTWQDYVAIPYSFGRFLLNTKAWPVSALVTPPGTPMVSDGQIGRDHDAATGTSPDPTATLADFDFDRADDAPPPIAESDTDAP